MKLLDKRTVGDLYRLVIFFVVTALATGLLVITIGNVTFGETKQYRAEFTDATGVVAGDDVRIAGVKVGTVEDVELSGRTRALVTFTVDSAQRLDTGTRAAIRYRNLIGQRYISLTDQLGEGGPMAEGDTIPVAQTSPALDLSVLFNGFKPLFQALSPDDINTLSYEIIQVFQGEGGTLDSLLVHTASLTSTLADRDEIINDLIDNLNDVLDHLGDRDEELSNLIVTFKRFVQGLAEDRNALLDPLNQISELTVEAESLVSDVKDPLLEDVEQLRVFAGALDEDKEELEDALQVQPIKLHKIGRTATYGSWFNFYLCSFNGQITLPGKITVPLNYKTGQTRCNLG